MSLLVIGVAQKCAVFLPVGRPSVQTIVMEDLGNCTECCGRSGALRI